MPGLNPPIISSKKFTMNFIDVGGAPGSCGVDGIPLAVTDAQLYDLIGAIANMTNAGSWSDNITAHREIPKARATALDEAYASVSDRCVFVFQNDALTEKTIRIPAPDLSLFSADGVTVDPTNTLVIDLIADALVVLNTGGGTYAFSRGYRIVPGQKTPLPRVLPEVSEPAVGVNPPAAPAP